MRVDGWHASIKDCGLNDQDRSRFTELSSTPRIQIGDPDFTPIRHPDQFRFAQTPHSPACFHGGLCARPEPSDQRERVPQPRDSCAPKARRIYSASSGYSKNFAHLSLLFRSSAAAYVIFESRISPHDYHDSHNNRTLRSTLLRCRTQTARLSLQNKTGAGELRPVSIRTETLSCD